MNGDRPADAVHRQHLVVLHRVLVAEIIARDSRVEVVRGIDVDLAVEHVRRRIGAVDVDGQRLGQELLRIGAGRLGGLGRFGHGRLAAELLPSSRRRSRNVADAAILVIATMKISLHGRALFKRKGPRGRK